MRHLLLGVVIIVGLVSVSVAVQWILTAEANLPAGSQSAQRTQPGPYHVDTRDIIWTDESRGTEQNNEYPGASSRTLHTTMWIPRGVTEPVPLTVYSHGFMGQKGGATFMAEHLASHGYLVVAPNFPLTNTETPGGAKLEDVVNQPADVSFVIDQTLQSQEQLDLNIDENRIGLFGLSLGGLTTTLATFHPRWKDDRVKAAVSLAGPADVFGPAFFDHADVPFLMMGGTADGIVQYEANAAPIPSRVKTGGLLTFTGGTHIGFDQFAMSFIRLFGNPDNVMCSMMPEGDSEDAGKSPFNNLFGTAEDGLLDRPKYPDMCLPTDDFMRSADQHALTKIALHAFFESHFSANADDRAGHHTFFTETIVEENDRMAYTASHR